MAQDTWNPIRWSPDRWIAFSAFVTAGCALVLTICESRAAREHQRRSALPEIQVAFWYTDEKVGFRMNNAGLGPAYLHWFEVLVDDKPVPHWRAMFDALGFEEAPAYGFTVPTEGWYSPDEPGNWILAVSRGHPLQQRFREESPRVEPRGCFCSLYDECWRFSRSVVRPEPTETCEPHPEPRFSSAPPRKGG